MSKISDLRSRVADLQKEREDRLQQLGKLKGERDAILSSWKKKGITEKNVKEVLSKKKKRMQELETELEKRVSKLEKELKAK